MTDQTLETRTLDDLAEKIVKFSNEADERVIEAAKLVREARGRVERGEAGDVTWYEWARKNIKISGSRLRELQRIAKADEPMMELERTRKMTDKRVRDHRERKKLAALRNGGDTAGQAAQLEPKREQLIEIAQSASLNHIEKLLSLYQELAAEIGTTASDQDVDHAGDAGPSEVAPKCAGVQIAAE